MIFLLFSIGASLIIFIVFKLLQKFKVNTFQAIVVNYFVAFGFGILSTEKSVSFNSLFNADWFLGSVIVGALFIGLFTLMAITAQNNGLSVASVASKMSVIIPIVFGIFFFSESAGIYKILGIILAVLSVVLVSIKSKSGIKFQKNIALPLLLFIGSGLSDTYINYLQHTAIPEEAIPLFSACVFAFAGIIGILILLYRNFTSTVQLDFKSIIGGTLLGLANYASLYYIIKALQLPNMESSTFYTLNNVGVVMGSTVIGLFLFKEHLSRKNWIGIGLAVIAIYLVTF